MQLQRKPSADHQRRLRHMRTRSQSRMLRSLFAALAGVFALAVIVGGSSGATAQDDQTGIHNAWSNLLAECVVPIDNRNSTAADYACFRRNQAELDAYTSELAQISPAIFSAWTQNERLAFLINAYNAWTVQLILKSWPELESIRDLGSLLRSPWKKSFIPLLGKTQSLDDIEHGMIREPGVYDDPRIHFAVNCASVGCPALRAEAYEGARIDAQLEQQTRAFLGDQSRNRLRNGRLEVSSIFKWYRGDFENGWRGTPSLASFLSRYAEVLGLSPAQEKALRSDRIKISFLDYDWKLNDV